MIALERVRTVDAVHEKYRGLLKKASDKELLKSYRDYLLDNTKKVSFTESFWTKAKPQLKKESNGKCAYCEANTKVVAHGDVEHYRPKSVYWWLAYTYDNYLYACQICNQTYKSDNFPIGSLALVVPNVQPHHIDTDIDALVGKISPDPIDTALDLKLTAYIKAHKKEKPFLINPYIDNPAKYFAYEADDVLEEVKIVPTKPLYKNYVEASEKYYGINRIELKNFRYSVYSLFRVLKMSHGALPEGAIKKETKKQIDNMLLSKYLFSGMNRYFDKKI